MSSAEREALLAELVQQSRLDQNANGALDAAFNDFLGISRTDGRCLDIVHLRGRLTAGQLAEEAGLTSGAVTGVLDRLEAAGYVRRVRDEHDRRRVLVEPTEELLDLAERVYGAVAHTGAEMLEEFRDDELEVIVRYLRMSVRMHRAAAASVSDRLGGEATLAQRLRQAKAIQKQAKALVGEVKSEWKSEWAARKQALKQARDDVLGRPPR